MPKDFRVAEVARVAGVGQDGIAGILGPGAAAVGAVGQCLRLDFGLFGLFGVGVVIGKEGEEWRVLFRAEAGGVFPVYYGASGEDVAEAVGCEGDGQVFPVHEVAADGVPPVHGPPNGFFGVVLIEEVVFSVEVDKPVGVVHPVFGGREVDLRAVHFVVRAGEVLGCVVGRGGLVSGAGGEAEQGAQCAVSKGFHVERG